MQAYGDRLRQLEKDPRTWLVTGVAGFIGSNILEELLRHGQRVIGLDNFATGSRENLQDVATCVGAEAWSHFTFHEADIRELEACREGVRGVDFVLHQAALGSVPRSIADPIASHQANVDGTLNLLLAARDAGVHRMVFASSSSVYGDNQDLPKVESRIGKPLSPYALTKRMCEEYARIFSLAYGFHTIGLRYFNVFGPRQNIAGPYAAVIPRWITELMAGEQCTIHGDGETARDFTFVANVVMANILAATCPEPLTQHRVFNIACGHQTTLNELYERIRMEIAKHRPEAASAEPQRAPFREGDIRHSLADIQMAEEWMGYDPIYAMNEGLRETVLRYAVPPWTGLRAYTITGGKTP